MLIDTVLRESFVGENFHEFHGFGGQFVKVLTANIFIVCRVSSMGVSLFSTMAAV